MIRPGSQNAAILEALGDGQWHTTAAIHTAAGFSRLNSRVSELRVKHGYTIEQRHVDGAGTGPHAHEYRLVETSGAGNGTPAGLYPGATADGASPFPAPGAPVTEADGRGRLHAEPATPASSFEQLRLVAA